MLAYLTLAANPHNITAFVRVVNVPKRNIGDKSVQELLTKARELDIKPMDLADQIVHGSRKFQGIKPAVTKNLKQFVDVIARIRRQAMKVNRHWPRITRFLADPVYLSSCTGAHCG